jgi:RNA polymerase sigma-70 factor (ECF subfamily)
VSRTIDQALLNRALSRGGDALTQLVEALTPVIQARVARCVLRWKGGAGGVRQHVEDLTQEVFMCLFADGGRVLRDWAPEKGLSLENFVGLVAQRQAVSMLRTGKRNPWREEATDSEILEAHDSAAPGPEAVVASQDTLEKLLERLREELSPLGWQLFELLYVRERSVDEVRTETGLSADAVYAWRSRLRKLARRRLGELTSENAEPSRITSGEVKP